MLYANHLRGAGAQGRFARALTLALVACCAPNPATAQTPSASPASVPAGALDAKPVATPPPASVKPAKPVISARQAREADDAYLEGAKEVQRRNTVAAERDFARAVQLNPNDRDYALALLVTREGHLSELVQQAARARMLGDAAHADALLAEARAIDPDNPVIAQHFGEKAADSEKPADRIGAALAGPVHLEPSTDPHDFHLSGDAQSLLRQVYQAYGITLAFDPSVTSNAQIKFNFDAIRFDDATRILATLTHTFVVPVQPKAGLVAKDTQENRDALQPLIEETIYLPGLSQDQMTELANVARTVFDVKQVTASPTGGFMLVRGDERVLDQLNATYADMLDGGSEVLFDVNLYELDKTYNRNIGATTPGSLQAFDLVQAATSLINANQSLLAEAASLGVTFTGTSDQIQLEELAFLIKEGVSGASQFTSLLGTLGTYGGVPLLGIALAEGSTFNLLAASSDARILDSLQVRSTNHQPVTFRSGSRYPIVTATYSGGISSGLASQLAGLTINGQSAASLLAKYGVSATSVSVPQFQFEDLGITLKMTPQVMHNAQVQLTLEMKIEALAGTSINNIPILDNRALSSTVTVPVGQSAMLATLVTRNEMKSLDGLPGLSELPGFQGTDQNVEKDSTELLIVITPHLVRSGALHIASRRLAAVRAGGGQ